jgi:hypothetical protein
VAHETGYELGQVYVRERKQQEMMIAIVRAAGELTPHFFTFSAFWECTVMAAMVKFSC